LPPASYKMGNKKTLSVIVNLQIIFWIAFVFISTYSSSQTTSLANSITRTLLVLPLQLVLFYTCYLYLVPQYFEKKKYLQFSGLLVLLIGVTTVLRLLLKNFVFDWIDFHIISLSFIEQLMVLIISQILVVLISSLLAVAKKKYEFEKRYQETQNQFLESELNYLKSQVSPHFLLNTLNNIYSFALTNSPETPNAVLKLSEMLKYFLYESSRKKIMVGRELEIIQSYIELFQLRFQDDLDISVNFCIKNEQKEIEPLLLMSLVENTFKHSGIGTLEKAFIRIKAEEKDNHLIFSTHNSKMEVNETINQYGGIGLQNISKRLLLNYPGRHELNVMQDDASFSVTLIIPFL
jgi:two-component system, LytTR family, sensor kinase